ncbi:hypothetical protein [Cytophaga sp. FL35]|uniref:hypothetical protein n=1 Tax=Cytophaga sp. FL35 TaxID=1904456 RepID=UPI001653D336|nr:hypothetical protein [Cytophaga sp. FL35]MBC7000736.1 hypothetical protein [Cytophaga sp. FL35]
MKAYIIDRDLVGLFAMQYKLQQIDIFDYIMVCDDLSRAKHFILNEGNCTLLSYMFIIKMHADSSPERRLLHNLCNVAKNELKFYIISDSYSPKVNEVVKDYSIVRGILNRPIHQESILNMLSKETGETHSVRV